MSKDDEKIMLYINVTWLKAFLKLILIVIIPYEIVLFVLLKLSVFPAPVWWPLSLWGAFAISFVWGFIRRHRLANKEK